MDFIYYIIFNTYYKHGNFKNDKPPFTVFFIWLLCFFCITLSLKTIYEIVYLGPYYKGKGFGKYSKYLIGILCGTLVYFMFYFNKRYVNIYLKYRNNHFANGLVAKLFTWFFVIFLIASPFLTIFLRNLIYPR